MSPGAALVVRRSVFEGLPIDRRAQAAALAGLDLGDAKRLVTLGHDLPVAWARNGYVAARRKAEARALTGLSLDAISRPRWVDTWIGVGLGVVLSLCGLADTELWFAYGFALIGAAALAVHAWRARAWGRLERAVDARGGLPETEAPPENTGELTDVARWTRYALLQPRDSEEWSDALVAIAEVQDAHGASEGASAALSELAGPAPATETVAIPVPARPGPHRMGRYIVVRCASYETWPRRCPHCNRPGAHPTTWTFEQKASAGGQVPFVVKLLGGAMFHVLDELNTKRRRARARVFLCLGHRWLQRVVWTGIVAIPIAAPLGFVLLLEPRPGTALILLAVAPLAWFGCWVATDRIAPADSTDQVLRLRGAHPDFVASLRAVPDGEA